MDPLEKGDATNKRERWELFVEEFDPQASTRDVWRTYGDLRAVLMKPILQVEEQAFVGPASFAHFAAFTQRYTAPGVHLYSHMFFHHSCVIIEKFKSVGLYKNEVIEAMNSYIKRYLDKHSAKNGWGTEMTYDVMLNSRRRLGDILRDINEIMADAIEKDNFKTGTWAEMRELHLDTGDEDDGNSDMDVE